LKNEQPTFSSKPRFVVIYNICYILNFLINLLFYSINSFQYLSNKIIEWSLHILFSAFQKTDREVSNGFSWSWDSVFKRDQIILKSISKVLFKDEQLAASIIIHHKCECCWILSCWNWLCHQGTCPEKLVSENAEYHLSSNALVKYCKYIYCSTF